MNNREFVLKAMEDTYGLLPVSSEVNQASVLFVELMVHELNRRDHIITSLAEGTFAPAASALLGTLADDLAKMSRDARSMVLPVPEAQP